MHIISSMDVQAQGWPRAMHSGSEYASDGNHQLFKKKEQYRVFLVEDDLDDRRLTIQSLRQSPYIDKIHSFESGDRLIEYFIRKDITAGI